MADEDEKFEATYAQNHRGWVWRCDCGGLGVELVSQEAAAAEFGSHHDRWHGGFVPSDARRSFPEGGNRMSDDGKLKVGDQVKGSAALMGMPIGAQFRPFSDRLAYTRTERGFRSAGGSEFEAEVFDYMSGIAYFVSFLPFAEPVLSPQEDSE